MTAILDGPQHARYPRCLLFYRHNKTRKTDGRFHRIFFICKWRCLSWLGQQYASNNLKYISWFVLKRIRWLTFIAPKVWHDSAFFYPTLSDWILMPCWFELTIFALHYSFCEQLRFFRIHITRSMWCWIGRSERNYILYIVRVMFPPHHYVCNGTPCFNLNFYVLIEIKTLHKYEFDRFWRI